MKRATSLGKAMARGIKKAAPRRATGSGAVMTAQERKRMNMRGKG